MAQRGGAERVEARFDSAKGLAALVGTLRRSKPISGELRASAYALELLAQTSSVSTVVRMPKPALRRFEHSTDPPSALRVGINLQSVAEACSLLSACGGESEGEVVLTYPGRDGRLVLEIEGTSRQDSERVAHSAAFATIASEEPSDLERVELATAEEGAEPPEHEVIAAAEVSTGVLKEVVDDVEWAGGSVHVELQPNAGIKLSSDGGTGHVGIEVECACTQGSSPSNQDAVVDVKHNHLKNACPLPSAFTSIDKGCVTRVTLMQKEQSSLALLRISHHVRLTPHRTACTVCFFVHPLETAVLAT